jgi:hypothetical protein
MLLRLKGPHLEYFCLIDRSMVQLDIVLENLGNRWFFENRLPGAFRFAGAAVDTFVRMNIKHVGEIFVIIANIFINAIDRTDADTSGIDAIDAEPGYRPWHKSKSSLCSSLPLSPLARLVAGGVGMRVPWAVSGAYATLRLWVKFLIYRGRAFQQSTTSCSD